MPVIVNRQIASDRIRRMRQFSSAKDAIAGLMLVVSLLCLICLIVAMGYGIQRYHTSSAEKSKIAFGFDHALFEETWLTIPVTLLWLGMVIILVIGLCQGQNEVMYIHFYAWMTTILFIIFFVIMLTVYAKDNEPNFRRILTLFNQSTIDSDLIRNRIYYIDRPGFYCDFYQHFHCCGLYDINQDYCNGARCYIPNCCCDVPPCTRSNSYQETCYKPLRKHFVEGVRVGRFFYLPIAFLMFINTVLAIILSMILSFRHQD